MFEAALRLADNQTLTLAIVYNEKLLYKPPGNKMEANYAVIPKLMMRNR